MPLRDIIELLGTINTIKRQQEAQALAEQNSRVGAFSQFAQLLSHQRGTENMVPLIHSFSENSGINEEALRDIAAHYTPPSSDVSAGLFGDYVRQTAGTPEGAMLGRETAFAQGTGRGAGAAAASGAQSQAFGSMDDALRRAFTTQTIAGLTPGGMAQDQSIANMSGSELAHANAIRMGLSLGAGEQQQGQIAREGQQLQSHIAGEQINQADRDLAQRGILGLIEAGAKSGGGMNSAISDARSRYQKNLEAITTKPTNKAGQRAILDNMRQDYDFINGQGAFVRQYPEIYNQDLNPSAILRILGKW